MTATPTAPALDLLRHPQHLPATVRLPAAGCVLVLPALPPLRVAVSVRPDAHDPARPDPAALGWALAALWGGDA